MEGCQGATPVKNRVVRKLFCEEGVPLLEVRLELPGAEGLPASIGAYYKTLEETLLRLGEERLFPEAQAAYLSDPSPGRRFTFRRDLLRVVCHGEIRENWFSVSRRTELRIRGSRRESEGGEVFSLSDGSLCPLSQFLEWRKRRGAAKQMKCGRISWRAPYYLAQTGVILWTRRGRRVEIPYEFGGKE